MAAAATIFTLHETKDFQPQGSYIAVLGALGELGVLGELRDLGAT